jgi:hypothetical protein
VHDKKARPLARLAPDLLDRAHLRAPQRVVARVGDELEDVLQRSADLDRALDLHRL